MHPRTAIHSSDRLMAELPAGHVVRALLLEHARLLGFLDRLDHLIEDYRDASGTHEARAIADEIQCIACDLSDAEPHHQREERVLFPELEKRGVSIPPRLMRMEHDQLRALEKSLAAAAGAPRPEADEIAGPAGSLASMLRDHIAKENEVLYPMALQMIPEPQVWEQMKRDCARIGPCCWSSDLV